MRQNKKNLICLTFLLFFSYQGHAFGDPQVNEGKRETKETVIYYNCCHPGHPIYDESVDGCLKKDQYQDDEFYKKNPNYIDSPCGPAGYRFRGR